MVENYLNYNNSDCAAFAVCCNCIARFVSSRMKAFKLQMVAPTPVTAAASSSYYLGPLDQRPSI